LLIFFFPVTKHDFVVLPTFNLDPTCFLAPIRLSIVTGIAHFKVTMQYGETQMINKYAIGARQERLAKQVQNIWETQKE